MLFDFLGFRLEVPFFMYFWGSPVGVAECCTCCGSRRKASWLWVGAVEVVKKLLRNTGQAAIQNSQAVGPGNPKSQRGIANSRGKAKAPTKHLLSPHIRPLTRPKPAALNKP